MHHCCCYCAILLLLRLTRVLLAASTLLLWPCLRCCCRLTRRRRGGNSRVTEGYSASTAELSAAPGVVRRSLLLSARRIQGHGAHIRRAQGRAPGLTSARTLAPSLVAPLTPHFTFSVSLVIIAHITHGDPRMVREKVQDTKFIQHVMCESWNISLGEISQTFQT